MGNKQELLRTINASIDKCYTSLAYAAPELQDEHWSRLRKNVEADVDNFFDEEEEADEAIDTE